jgi:DUF4097 and DUF4098 domain-containing protein YvlB
MGGDVLEIDHPQLRWDNFIDVFSSFRGTAKADISIMVPRDVAMKFGVISAEALISGLANDAKVSTVNGDVVIDNLTGNLELNGVNGELSVRNHTGEITAHTVSGDITVSGRLRRFSVDGVSSNVFLDIEGIPDRIMTNTVTGNVTVRLGTEVAARYRLNTVTGRLQLDDQTIRTTFGKGYEGSSGQLDGSWLELQANSVSGDISVVRRTGSAPAGPASTGSSSSESSSSESSSSESSSSESSSQATDAGSEASA